MNKRSFHDVAGAGWGRKIRSTLVKVFKSFFIRIALVNEQRNVCQLSAIELHTVFTAQVGGGYNSMVNSDLERNGVSTIFH